MLIYANKSNKEIGFKVKWNIDSSRENLEFLLGKQWLTTVESCMINKMKRAMETDSKKTRFIESLDLFISESERKTLRFLFDTNSPNTILAWELVTEKYELDYD